MSTQPDSQSRLILSCFISMHVLRNILKPLGNHSTAQIAVLLGIATYRVTADKSGAIQELQEAAGLFKALFKWCTTRPHALVVLINAIRSRFSKLLHGPRGILKILSCTAISITWLYLTATALKELAQIYLEHREEQQRAMQERFEELLDQMQQRDREREWNEQRDREMVEWRAWKENAMRLAERRRLEDQEGEEEGDDENEEKDGEDDELLEVWEMTISKEKPIKFSEL
jgi:hypothetical protein